MITRLSILILLICTNFYGQISSGNIISDEINRPRHLGVHDIDGDGDLDVVSNTIIFGDSGSPIIPNPPTVYRIMWYENTDGQGLFETETVIWESSEGLSVNEFDYDGDNDIDILSEINDDIVWFENIDGQGNFSDPQIIVTNNSNVTSIILIDIDNDGDNDIIGKDNFGVFLYKNDNGIFDIKNTVSNNSVTSFEVADLDSDNDNDVVVTSFDEGVFWYENEDGQGTFSSRKDIVGFGNGAAIVFPVDIDGDSDLDIVFGTAAAVTFNRFSWVENLDGKGNFDTENIINSDSENGFDNIAVFDFDNDGNLDVIGDYYDNNNNRGIGFYKNDGQGNFEIEELNIDDDFFVSEVIGGDINSDGEIDLILNDFWNGKIIWFENLINEEPVLSNYDIILNNSDLVIYPNPTLDFLNFNKEVNKVSVYDINGDNIIENKDLSNNSIDISTFINGVYFVEIKGNDKLIKIIKE